ncbi:MAG TPA: amidophosphoribosyltransferase [Verrucomicrobiae bacterium]|nr:amidophosphoribosyltransferase [Verrucomicrobiae bacterium]
MMTPREIREKCAVFGICGAEDAARITFFGLYALQHRGQEGSGICCSDGTTLRAHRQAGLVNQIYTEEVIAKLHGSLAIGHNRYSTSGGSDHDHIQPIMGKDRLVAVAHNGNLPSTAALEVFLKKHGIAAQNLTDSEMMAAAIKYYLIQGHSLSKAVAKAFPLFTGAFSLLVMTSDTLVAIRDHCGIRPLALGQLEKAYVVASETCAFDTIGATFMREVLPGEMVTITAGKLKSQQLAPPNQKLDIFEFVYFSRPDSYILGKSVDQVRKNMGAELARETEGLEADIVVPVPDSGITAAQGYAEASGIPLSFALIKNRYIGRTFIQPEQQMRDVAVRMKLNPIRSALAGKRVILVDDSIVRGTTSPQVIKLLKAAGAREVHFMVSSPPFRYPDFYGMDVPSQEHLIAVHKTEEEIRDFLGVDSLHYLSYPGLIAATELPEDQFCTSCFSGIYPIDLHERAEEVTTLPHWHGKQETLGL